MPREDRRIIFDYTEVYKAIFALCTQRQMAKPPPGRIMAVREEETEGKLIRIDLENPQQSEAAHLDYSRDFLAAALMLFCKGQGIPLPKNAQKSVVIGDGQVVLRVQI